MFRNSGPRPSSIVFLLSSLVLLLALTGCGGNGGSAPPPSNVGGGYTLKASGGTLNDGSGVKGLSVLITLRDSTGNGPGGAAGWLITITGPGINPPLVVSYDDGSPGSYITWWWSAFNPVTGVYTATATNGSTTLTFNFSIDAAKSLSQPVLNKSGNTIYWNSVTGAGSYQYRVTNGTGTEVMSGYFSADSLQSTYSFQLPVLTDDGSYLIEVFAQTANRVALQNDFSASPTLASQENISLAPMDFVVGGTGSGYSLDARGGVLYEGVNSFGIDNFGLVIWTSLTTNSTSSTPPAGDWNMTVTGPGITTPITFTYPRTYSQYAYWDFGMAPAPGTYTVSAIASGGTTTVSQTFTIPAAASKLPVATGLAVTPVSGGGANVSWSAVSGAKSYYVNVWTTVGDYTEVAGAWVTSISAVIPTKTLTKGAEYDIYVTACESDMTDISSVPPADPGAQVDMSDTTFTYETIIAQ